MSAPAHVESTFEAAIETSLHARGWVSGTAEGYDPKLGLDPVEMGDFLAQSQADEWDHLTAAHGSVEAARREFAKLVARQIDTRGVLDVLRHGVKDRGTLVRLAFFRPAHTLAVGALDEYDANRLTIVRQLHYSATEPRKSIDLTLFVNGIPVATAELKNPASSTGQTVKDAMEQYRRNRDPKDPIFAKRTLVHFAVDPSLVFITTRLAGAKTRFLPFNLGTGGPGENGGAGNPPARPGAHRTSYLWEQVWARDAWLDLLQRYLHVEDDRSRSGRGPSAKPGAVHALPLIFPRYHQWHAVTTLADHAATHGVGTNYLIQHSAGSGKSNTIAWLAHRLSSLHTPADPTLIAPQGTAKGLGPNQLVFDKIIVITDRVVLDRQLQDTIYQFEHVSGVVERIDEDSAQLAEVLSGTTARIVITTLQKFPHILDKVAGLGQTGRYAILVDEAHSSQTGSSITALKKAIGKLGIDDLDDDGNLLTASAFARGKQPNLSFFAFTATPKKKTLNIFGTPHPATGILGPFHVYSMHQAIEEGFILDVLRNFTHYDTYYKLHEAAAEFAEKQVERGKAKGAVHRAALLHSSSLEHRAKVIVDHFRRFSVGSIESRAKAMVVTMGRKEAVGLYKAIRAYVEQRGFTDCGVLVAFSGTVDWNGTDYTEAKLNGFSERELPERFGYVKVDDEKAAARDQEEFRILVVADKYQTGFDQPLLTTMYVDKKLDGVAAVQTLSRLNRTHPKKYQDDVLVVDFRNSAEDIQAAFKDYFETTITVPVDPNLLYALEHAVVAQRIIEPAEMDALVAAYLEAEARHTAALKEKAHAAIYRFTDPALDRYTLRLATDPESAEAFRTALRDYVRGYGFLVQAVDYSDEDLERLYLYGKFLLARLPKEQAGAMDVGEVAPSHMRIAKTAEVDLRLAAEGAQMLPGFTAADAGTTPEPDLVPLAQIIAELSEEHGFGLNTADQIWYGQQIVALAEDPQLAQVGLMNDEDKFGQVFDKRLEQVVIGRAEANDTLVKRFFDEEAFHSVFVQVARRQAYSLIRSPARRETAERLRAIGQDTSEA
jgi:type I restriction enzyme, R subunit